MSENRMLLDEIRELKRRLQALETRGEHPGFAASDVARRDTANMQAMLTVTYGVEPVANGGTMSCPVAASTKWILKS